MSGQRSRRACVFLAIAAGAGACPAQTIGDLVQRGLGTLRDRQLLPQDQPLPTQPSGNPLPPPKQPAELPLPGPLGPEGGQFRIIQGGENAVLRGNLIEFTGGVEFTNRGYHVWADEGTYDRSTEVALLRGNVRIEGADRSIHGELVQADFRFRTFIAEDAESTLKPPFTRRLRDNVYVKAHRSYGSEREVFGEQTAVTTCSYPSPHYEIVADYTDVRPGRRVIFRKVRLMILGHTVITLPYLSIPLDERSYNNLPRVGHSQVEGYWIKNRYGIPLPGGDSLNTRLDYYTRLGTGVGGDYHYDADALRGVLRVYSIFGPHNQLEINSQHRQNFGWGSLMLDNSYQNNNYLISASSRILNTRAQLLIPQGRTSTRLNFFRSSSESGTFDTLQQSLALSDTRVFSSRFNTNLELTYAQNRSTFGGGQDVRRQQLDVKFRAVNDLELAQARLDYLRSIPIGESTNFFSASDVTPAITLLTDSRRLFGPGGAMQFPFQSELSWGEFGDPVTKDRISRGNFNFQFQNPPSSVRNRLRINYQGAFRQSLYSDDTAQYVLRAGTQLGYSFGRDGVINFRYNYNRPYGFTPLQIDRTGRTNILTSDLSWRPIRNLLLGGQTGYDFNIAQAGAQTPWQQVGLRAEYGLGRYFNARALSTYDTTRHAFSTTRLDVTWIPGGTYVSFGAKYDGIRNKWAAANLFVDGIQMGRLRTSVLLNYNGYLSRFEAQHYSFIYDLHCAEAVIQVLDNPTGFNAGRTITFFLRLKALPFDTPFGSGQRGQPIGTGTGRDF